MIFFNSYYILSLSLKTDSKSNDTVSLSCTIYRELWKLIFIVYGENEHKVTSFVTVQMRISPSFIYIILLYYFYISLQTNSKHSWKYLD